MAGYKEVMDSCLCLHLRQAARVVTQRLDDALRPVGLRTTQFTVLAVLAESGAIPVTDLADIIVADRTTLTRVLDRLEDQGFILRREDKIDRRSRAVALTAAGRSVVKRGYRRWRKAHQILASDVGASRVKRLLSELRTVSHPVESTTHQAAPKPRRKAKAKKVSRKRARGKAKVKSKKKKKKKRARG